MGRCTRQTKRAALTAPMSVAIAVAAAMTAVTAAAQPLALTETTPSPAPASGDELVSARLVSDVQSIAPGNTFTLAVRLDIAAGWHVYWRYPGDAGMATHLTWRLPEGFKAGDLQWPIPERFSESGNITSYGYSDTVTLLAEVTAPNRLPETDKLTFDADVSWLVCRERCLQGRASRQLALAIGEGKPSQHHAKLQDVKDRLPKHADRDMRPGVEPRTHARARPFHVGKIEARPGGRTAVTIHWHLGDGPGTETPGRVDVYPLPTDRQQVTRLRIERRAAVSKIRVDVDRLDTGEATSSTRTLGVLLTWQADGAERRSGTYIDLPLKSGHAND